MMFMAWFVRCRRAGCVALLILATLVAASSCGPDVRTDPAPLQRRLKLPAIGAVRWVATTKTSSSSRIDIGPHDFVHLHAYIEVPAASWSALPTGEPTTLELPSETLAILPSDRRRAALKGLAVTIQSAADDVTVDGAIRLGDALLVSLTEVTAPELKPERDAGH